MADKQSREGNPSMTLRPMRPVTPKKLKVGIDISDALKGLKAIQREARKATAALKELEEQKKKNMSLSDVKGLRPHTLVFEEINRTCQCGGDKFKLQSIGENIKGVKLVCNDCGCPV